MQKDIVVEKSKINKKGVFALHDFKKGEVVLKWNPNVITKAAVGQLPARQRAYVLHSGRKYFLMQAPEKFVNHSCESNTLPKNFCDVARRNIKKGEEITSDYGRENLESFSCTCGSKKCKKIIS